MPDEIDDAIQREDTLAESLAKDMRHSGWHELVDKVARAAEAYGPELAMSALRIALLAAGARL